MRAGSYVLEGRTITVSNPDKPLWPEGVMKRDLLDYYLQVAPWLLPQIQDRPLSFTRWPDGIGGKSFFQKNPPAGTPEWVRTFLNRETRYLLIDDRPGLSFLANLAVIEIHMWLSRVPDVDHPDLAVIDLDPMPPLGFEAAREVALMVRAALDRLGLVGYPKTSGATGIHIFLPIDGTLTARQVTEAVRSLGETLNRVAPGLVSLERKVRDRVGVYFDYGQNSPTRTMAAPYSLRPLAGAPVSCPVSWEELQFIDPAAFNIRTVPKRLTDVGCAWASMAPPQSLALLRALAGIKKE